MVEPILIKAENQISLELINESHAQPIFEMVNQNRVYLRQWLSFVDNMVSVDFAENFVKGSMQRHQLGVEYAFVIQQGGQTVGRIGVYKLDRQNKIGEIGYWLVENVQGQGIITTACKAMIRFCFDDLLLHRIEIKCATGNTRSQSIPVRLGFTKEGIIREGEWLHDKYVDLFLYSLLTLEYPHNK